MVACFDAVRLFIFVYFLTPQPHFTLWLSARTLQCLFVWGCACHNVFVLYLASGARLGGRGTNAPGRHFWWKEEIANGLSRMNLKLDLGFTFWLRLDLPHVWPGLSRFKRLSRCTIPVSKISQNFTSLKFSK